MLKTQAASEFLASIADLSTAMVKDRKGLPQDWHGPEHMVDHVVRMCFLGVESNAKRVNNLLGRAKTWWPQDQALQSLAPLNTDMPFSPSPEDLFAAYEEAEAAARKLHRLVQSRVKGIDAMKTVG